jgi:hypothetical protein
LGERVGVKESGYEGGVLGSVEECRRREDDARGKRK